MVDINITEIEQELLINLIKRNGVVLPEFWGSLTFHFKEGRVVMSNVDISSRIIVQYDPK